MDRTERDYLRMAVWLLIGICLYVAVALIGPAYPVAQTACLKAANVTTFAWVGYWAARQAVGRVERFSSDGEKIARAIVIGTFALAGALGL